jgi:hypothetical protein
MSFAGFCGPARDREAKMELLRRARAYTEDHYLVEAHPSIEKGNAVDAGERPSPVVAKDRGAVQSGGDLWQSVIRRPAASKCIGRRKAIAQ